MGFALKLLPTLYLHITLMTKKIVLTEYSGECWDCEEETAILYAIGGNTNKSGSELYCEECAKRK